MIRTFAPLCLDDRLFVRRENLNPEVGRAKYVHLPYSELTKKVEVK
jgi:hypothetical protein